MKWLTCCLFLLCSTAWLPAQEIPEWRFISRQQADSLQWAAQHVPNDTLKMSASRSLGFYYQEINRDSALHYHQQQLAWAQKLNLKIWEADAYSQEGDVFRKMGNYQEALESFQKGIAIAEDPENEPVNWRINSFSNAGDLTDARLSVLAMLYHDMSWMYHDVSETEKQKSSLSKTIEIGENIHNGKVLSLAYSSLSLLYPPDSAMPYLRKALAYADESGYTKYNGELLFRIAAAYHSMGRGDSAFIYLRKAVQVHAEQNNLIGLIFCLDQMARAFTTPGLNNPDSSLYYANRVYTVAVQTASPEQILLAYNTLSYVNHFLRRTDTAYKYETLASRLNDSIKNNTISSLTGFYKFSLNEQQRLKKLEEERVASQNRLKITALVTGLVIFLFIGLILFRNNRQKQRANTMLQKTLSDLKSTQAQLIQSEKMASLGELTAGIAHEIQNPLNFVNNFSELNKELIEELKSEKAKAKSEQDEELETQLLNDMEINLEKIYQHGKRADAIVKGMLQHSGVSSGQKEPTDINALCDEYLRLSYHGLRAKDKTFNAQIKTDFDNTIGKIEVVPQDIGRVVLNLINNAFYACTERSRSAVAERRFLSEAEGSRNAVNENYEPTVTVSTKKNENKIEIKIKDNGNGIPDNIKEKIFQPFFTTKPTGQGTGLGLSLTYDIVKAHGGDINVETLINEGTTFIISLPIKNGQY